MKIRIVILILFFCFFFSCRKQEEHPVNFYYWKSKVSIGETEKKYFTELQSKKLYLRIFDVDKTGNTSSPIARITPFDSHILNTEYVPVIFITNQALQGISEKDISLLAKNILNLTQRTLSESKITSFNEIQLDCDWTSSTHTNYFRLLKELKTISGKKITCTLRLHQIKYKNKTGIPPVNKGYLMCYATSNPTKKSDKNTILDLNLLKNYLSDVNNYPISFDIALPLYSWGIVTNHLGEIKLINGLTSKELEEKKFIKIAENKYKVPEDLILHGLYLNKDFIIDTESISSNLLIKTKNYLNTHIKKKYDIVYYHLDSTFITHFPITVLQ